MLTNFHSCANTKLLSKIAIFRVGKTHFIRLKKVKILGQPRLNVIKNEKLGKLFHLII